MSRLFSTDPDRLRASPSQESPELGHIRPSQEHNSPNPSSQASSSPPMQYDDNDSSQTFDATLPNTTAHSRSSTYPPPQIRHETDPGVRPPGSETVHHTPQVSRHSVNLGQQFNVADFKTDLQNEKAEQAANGRPAQLYPGVSFGQTSTYEPEPSYSRSSSVQDQPSRPLSDAPRATRMNSQRQAAQGDLRRLSTVQVAGARRVGDEPNDHDQPVEDPDDEPVTLEVFRALIGIPQKGGQPLPLNSTRRAAAGDTPATPAVNFAELPASQSPRPGNVKRSQRFSNRLLKVLTLGIRHSEMEEELSTSIYYSLLEQQKINKRLYVLYDLLTYLIMISQLMIAAALIIVGALKADNHIPVAVLGGVTGVLTGILSLVKGQGFPNRLVQYLDSIRRVKEDIEFVERELRAGRRIVTYREVVNLKQTYDQVRQDEGNNRPDVWSTSLDPKVGTWNVGRPNFSKRQSGLSGSMA